MKIKLIPLHALSELKKIIQLIFFKNYKISINFNTIYKQNYYIINILFDIYIKFKVVYEDIFVFYDWPLNRKIYPLKFCFNHSSLSM